AAGEYLCGPGCARIGAGAGRWVGGAIGGTVVGWFEPPPTPVQTIWPADYPPRFPLDRSQTAHIFDTRDDPTHRPDTPENRQLLIDVASDPASRAGVDIYGNERFFRILPSG